MVGALMTRVRLLVAVAGILLTATGCTSLQGTGDKGFVDGNGAVRQIDAAQRGDAISLDGKDLDGRPISLASMRGKPTVVTVWVSWCTACRKDSPFLVAAQEQLGDRAHFVGIDSRDPGTAQAKAYNANFHITWPSFYSPGGEALLAFPGILTPNSVPTTVILDSAGRPAATISGAVPSTLTLVELVQDVIRHG
jgi:thiol-disulfide isomerase/thioredoxin